MAILQAVLTLLFRQMSRILNTAFGWATTLLFGKVPEDRQRYLSVIGLGSVLWLAVTIGIASPSVATFLLAFVPLPDWVEENWIRLIMLALAVLLPIVVGVISLFVVDPADRPKGIGGKLKAVLKGYPYTIGLALTLIMMIIAAPIIKAKNLIRRWSNTHVPVVIEADDYFEVVDELQEMLRRNGYETTKARASPLVRWPTKVFTFFASGAIEGLVAKELTMLKSRQLEILLHPSDLVINGAQNDVSRAHALITEHLTFTKAYLTWSKEAQEFEDRYEAIWQEAQRGFDDSRAPELLANVQQIAEDLKEVKVTYEEWEVLFREALLVERELLRHWAGVVPATDQFTESTLPGAYRSEEVVQRKRRWPSVAALGAGLAFMAIRSRMARPILTIDR